MIFSHLLAFCSIGDQIAAMLAVSVASSRTLEVLDLEGTGLTNQSAMVRKYLFFVALISLASHESQGDQLQSLHIIPPHPPMYFSFSQGTQEFTIT